MVFFLVLKSARPGDDTGVFRSLCRHSFIFFSSIGIFCFYRLLTAAVRTLKSNESNGLFILTVELTVKSAAADLTVDPSFVKAATAALTNDPSK
jgi:hypothetical protein